MMDSNRAQGLVIPPLERGGFYFYKMLNNSSTPAVAGFSIR